MSTTQPPKSQRDIIEALRRDVARLSPDVTFDIDTSLGSGEATLSADGYSYTLTGRGTFAGFSNVEFTAYFNAKGEPNYFRARVPNSASRANLNVDTLTAGADWQQLVMPDVVRNALVLSSWTAEFNTHTHRPSKLSLEFRAAGGFAPVDGLDLAMKEIAVGYEIENPLAPRNNPGEPEYVRKVAGLLSAMLTVFGVEAKLTSNLVTAWDEWKLSTDSFEVQKALPEAWKLLHGDDVLPWPSFMDHFSLSKLKVDLYPAGQLDLTGWTQPLGNVHVIVKRSSGGQPAPLSTQLGGEYAVTSTSPARTALIDLLLALSLPENPSFPGPLATLNSYPAVHAALVVSTFTKPTETTLPIFAGLGTGQTRVARGVTFLAMVDIDKLRDRELRKLLEHVCRHLAVEHPLSAVLFRGNLPLPPDPLQNFSASVSLTFTKEMSYFDRIFLRSISLEAKPAAADPEFTLYATVGVILNDPEKPLAFRAGFSMHPATLTLAGRGQMEGAFTIPRPFGFPKVSLANLSLSMGLKFSTEIPTPDNLFLSGQIMVNNLVGNATIGLDQNEVGKNMILARLCNVDFASVIDAFCGPEICRRVPRHVYEVAGSSGIAGAYLKLVPPGASPAFIGGVPPPDPGFRDNCQPLPAVRDEDFSPGYSMAGRGRLLNWDGMFAFSFEGDMSGLSAGLTAIGRMDPLPPSSPPRLPSGVTIFQISGSGGRGEPELFVDLSTRHVIGGISSRPSSAEAGSPASGYAQNQVIYCSGRITILGVTADTFLNLTAAGFQGMLHGDILGFLRGSIQVTIADFGNPLAGTSVSGSVDQRVVQTIQEKVEEGVKGVFGRRLASVLGSVSSKLLVIRRITFSGSLEDFRARLAVNVAYVAGGTADTMVVSIEARSLDAFAEHVGREVVRQSRAAFEAVIAEAERVVAEQAAAALAEASRKALSEMRARASEALSVARRTDEAEARAAEDVRRRLASAAHAVGSTGRQFQSVVRKAHDTFREFGEFTEAVATRVFDKPIRELTNAWDQLEKELKRAFTSADNEELVMKDGPAFNIFTRLAGGAVLAAPAVTRKNYPVSARPPGSGISDAWQLVPNDKITEGSFFLVSAYSGLLVAKPRDTHLSLIPHESDHKDRERMLMEAVPDEPGWYFLKYRDTYVRDRVRYQTYAELRSVVFDDAGALAKNPGFELRVPQWVLAPVAYPARSRPGDMGKFRFQIAGDIDWRASKSLPPRMTVAAGLREGGRYGAAGEPEQFVYTGGTFRWIPDPETLAAGGWAAQPLVMLSFGQRIGMILGPPLPTRVDGALLQVQGRPEVFIMDQGRRRWIPDAATFQNLGLHTDRIQVVTRADLDAIHSGEPLPSVVPKVVLHDRVLYQVPGDATVFVIRESTARAVPDPETLVAMGYDWSMVVTASAADLSAVRRGGRLPSRKDGALVRADGHPEVYVMEKALRRHIPDPETFRARGLEWGNVQVVSSTDLTDIPIGPSIPSARRAVPGAVPAAPSSDMAT